jgi:hypothetical protein
VDDTIERVAQIKSNEKMHLHEYKQDIYQCCTIPGYGISRELIELHFEILQKYSAIAK